MLVHNIPGDGEAQAVAGHLAAGGAQPVEAVEDALRVRVRQRRSFAGHGKYRIAAALCGQGYVDDGTGPAVFAGVVQQNPDELHEPLLVAVYLYLLPDVVGDLLAGLEENGLEGGHGLLRQEAEIHRRQRGGGHARVGAGQNQHALDEEFHPRRLGADVVQAREVLLAGDLVGVGDDFRVCQDDGQRRFQLMGRVGHELALAVPGLLHRARHPVGEPYADEKQDDEGPRADERRVDDLPVERLVLHQRVDEHVAGAGRRAGGAVHVAQIHVFDLADDLVIFPGGVHNLGDEIVLDLRAVFHDREGAGLIHVHDEDGIPPGRSPRNAGVVQVACDDAVQRVYAAALVAGFGRVKEDGENDDEHDGDNGHHDRHEFPFQFTNHVRIPPACSQYFSRR